MKLSIFLLTILSGFAGTIAMTIVMYIYANLFKTNTKVVHVLGSMITGDPKINHDRKTKVLFTGSVLHIFVGVLFSFNYFLLWNWGVFTISLLDSLIVGALSGVLAIIGWKFYFVVYHKLPKINLPHYFVALFVSHVVFGLVSVNVFNLMTDNPKFWFQLQEEISLALLTFSY